MSAPRRSRLIALYPRHWRERYRDEFDTLISDMSDGQPWYARLWLAIDVIRGAVDAQLHGESGMRKYLDDRPLRRGVLDGLVAATAISVVLFLSNVVYPKSPAESDSDPEYVRQLVAAYAVLLLFFLAVGVHARWRGGSALAGVKGGIAAGLTITVIAFATIAFIDNSFLPIVSQQHDKRMAFQHSGLSSMRLFLNLQNLMGLAVVLPGSALIGGALAGLGGFLGSPLTRRGTANPTATP
jgi:hypothetical protein